MSAILDYTGYAVNTSCYSDCMDDDDTFGEWITELYQEAGYAKQEDFADAIGYKQPTVSGWITGRRRSVAGSRSATYRG
jgi:hypothetical protein